MKQSAYRAACRFGLGASRRDLNAAGDDPVGWLTGQLSTPPAGPPASPSRESLTETFRVIRESRAARQQAAQSPSAEDDAAPPENPFRGELREAVAAQTLTQFRYAAETPAPFQERLVRFWSNHFTVSVRGRPQLLGSCLAYENEAIRPALGGHFGGLLTSVVRHPVMLIYLDNVQSMGPESIVGRRRDRGLNENLAREILELHTLGVHGGYEQKDVQALAGMLTGWTVGNERLERLGAVPGAFAFVPYMHEPGAFEFLGRRYPEGGEEQATAALTDLARHPATAEHVATKLVRHFVSDKPPERAVASITRVFRETDGHLPSVHRALVELPEAWDPEQQKFKTPQELLLSVYRGMALPPGDVRAVLGPLKLLNQIPFTASSPAGWPDEHAPWSAPVALKQRIEWALAFGRRAARGVDLSEISATLVDPRDEALRQSVARAESTVQALGLLLAAPGFQWR